MSNDERFAWIPSAAMKAPVGGNAFRVFVTLHLFADAEGLCHPTNERIAGECGLHQKSVARAITELEEAGLVCRLGHTSARVLRIARGEVPSSDALRTETVPSQWCTQDGNRPETQSALRTETVPSSDALRTETVPSQAGALRTVSGPPIEQTSKKSKSAPPPRTHTREGEPGTTPPASPTIPAPLTPPVVLTFAGNIAGPGPQSTEGKAIVNEAKSLGVDPEGRPYSAWVAETCSLIPVEWIRRILAAKVTANRRPGSGLLAKIVRDSRAAGELVLYGEPVQAMAPPPAQPIKYFVPDPFDRAWTRWENEAAQCRRQGKPIPPKPVREEVACG